MPLTADVESTRLAARVHWAVADASTSMRREMVQHLDVPVRVSVVHSGVGRCTAVNGEERASG